MGVACTIKGADSKPADKKAVSLALKQQGYATEAL